MSAGDRRGSGGAAMTYRARTIKRARRTRERVSRNWTPKFWTCCARITRSQCGTCSYRMTDPRLPEPVRKSERGYRHVQHRIVELRRAGTLPYGWITDATRRGYFMRHLRQQRRLRAHRMAGLYRADLWAQSHHYCEVWAESRSIAGVIQDTCEDLAVSLYPAGGFSSLTLTYEAARYIDQVAVGKPVTIFYVARLRPRWRADRQVHRARTARAPGAVCRALRSLGLPSRPSRSHCSTCPRSRARPGDKRAAHITGTVEAEAMPARLLRSCCAMLSRHCCRLERSRLHGAAEESASARGLRGTGRPHWRHGRDH